ncbi:MAG: cbb3-type cytochrome c oxidase subunit 3 [Pikeienuella sp.]
MDETGTYHLIREFAASWWLLVMMIFFVAVVLFTLRPGSKATHDDIAQIPLRNDEPKE